VEEDVRYKEDDDDDDDDDDEDDDDDDTSLTASPRFCISSLIKE